MKIKKIEIENFGKFHKYFLELDKGINIILGNNEDGKTTLMVFLKMMFYSEQKRSRDIINNPRKRYTPWNGLLMGGAIELENDGILYRIEKEMGTTPAKDKVKVINLQTGVPLLQKNEEIGKMFFGTDLAGFERSIFIGQVGSFGPDKEDEIAQKLSNMFSSGEESISQSQVQDRLGKAKEEIKSVRGNKGFLVEAKEELEKIKEAKAQIREIEESQSDLSDEYNQKKKLLQEKKDQKKRLEIWEKIQGLKSAQQKLQVLIEKVEEEKRLSEVIGEGKIPILQLDSFILDCQRLQGDIKSQEMAISHVKESGNLQIDLSKEIKEEEYRQFEKFQEDLRRVDQCQEYFQRNLIREIKDYNQTKDHVRQKSIEERKSKNKKIFFSGMAVSILLLVLDFIIHPLGLIVGIFSGGMNLFIYQRRNKKDANALENDPMIQKMEKSIEHQIQYFKEQFSTDYQLNMDAKQYLQDLLEKRTYIEEKIKSLLAEKGCVNNTEFQALYLDTVSNKKNQKTLDIMEKEYQEWCNKYLQKVCQYKEVTSFEMAKEQLEILEELIVEYKEKQQEIEHMANAMDVKETNVEALSKENRKILEQINQQVVLGQENLEESFDKESTVQQIEEEIGRLEELLPRLREEIRTPEKNLSQIETEQVQLEEKIQELQAYYDSLIMAETVMKEAGEEIRQSFGPELNQKTGEIFQQITGGKYKKVLVAKDYSMLAQPTDDVHYRESSYLSNGTIDQAYLALRLAITQLITKENESLPLLLDDVFMQYDDNRAKDGFTFLKNYSEEVKTQSQIIMFTCHSHIADLAKAQQGDKVNIIRL